MDYLRSNLFEEIEGRDIDVSVKTENSFMLLSFPDVFIDNNECICAADNELNIEWDKATIMKVDDKIIVDLPEVSYGIEVV